MMNNDDTSTTDLSTSPLLHTDDRVSGAPLSCPPCVYKYHYSIATIPLELYDKTKQVDARTESLQIPRPQQPHRTITPNFIPILKPTPRTTAAPTASQRATAKTNVFVHRSACSIDAFHLGRLPLAAPHEQMCLAILRLYALTALPFQQVATTSLYPKKQEEASYPKQGTGHSENTDASARLVEPADMSALRESTTLGPVARATALSTPLVHVNCTIRSSIDYSIQCYQTQPHPKNLINKQPSNYQVAARIHPTFRRPNLNAFPPIPQPTSEYVEMQNA
ncbi:uncharacterized protein CC84DRAFT_1227378 [Paraphaeosphaeria sporulosa]|uniref:Uncharacterized protein n=1 Tax=Paraphaeosphaeria sporulosa TaxID=1460663 RepID=A0A177D090_9PLEO|nr:uncharacterized protein CC84DRAFT_1227378 [Paraphaeosphaeria sporulosa]OAG12778.1 hypothetical protein CC84DRAFT_1227378 [Paraphaeosphaeria sporulosa]